MSLAHRYLSLRSQLGCHLLRDPFLGPSRLEAPSWVTITLGHALLWTSPEDRERSVSPLYPLCPVRGRARAAGAEGLRMGGRSAGPGWGDTRGASCRSPQAGFRLFFFNPFFFFFLLIFNLWSFCH